MNLVQSSDRTSVRYTGAVYTPADVAWAITKFVRSVSPRRKLDILEPSVGDGAFVPAIVTCFDDKAVTAVDIDGEAINRLRSRPDLGNVDVDFICSDFIQFASACIQNQRVFDLVVGNPPFIRRRNFSVELQESIEALAIQCDYKSSDLKNTWAAFLVASSRMLADDGIVAFVIPYELVTVSYGHAVLLDLLSRFDRIDIFIPDEKAFVEIDQDAIVFVGRRGNEFEKGLHIQRVSALDDLSKPASFRIDPGAEGGMALALNSFLIDGVDLPLIRRIKQAVQTVGNYCTSAPGIVTAANEFFIMTRQQAKELGVTRNTVRVLKRWSPAERSPIFRNEDFDRVSQFDSCRLLRLSVSKKRLSKAALSYVRAGEKAKLHLRYKCRNRDPWYAVPIVPVADGFLFRRSHSHPSLCVNQAGVFITDSAYGVNVNEKATIRGLCFSFYTSLTFLFAEIDGRFYGGGVLELSPLEFRGLPIAYHEPTDAEFEEFLALHSSAGVDVEKILDYGDRWLAKKLDLELAEVAAVRKSWRRVRAHRMRHGRTNGRSA
jgi:hypothetical protein